RADPPVGDADALRRLGGSADLRYWVVRDLADAVHAAAAETPLAIVLEDIHWADNGTLLALLHRANAAYVGVPAMSPGAVAEMVSDAVRANADGSLLKLAAKAHGNP